MIALDVLGGWFAINGGALPGSSNEICYFAPDTLRWRPLGCAHAALISSALGGGLDGFYEKLRWPGWQDEVAALGPGQGFSVYPVLWSLEGRADLAANSRKVVPLNELVAFHEETARQLADVPDGTRLSRSPPGF